MKHLLLLAFLSCNLLSCTTAVRHKVTATPTPAGIAVTKETDLYAKMGGQGAYDSTSGTGMKVVSDDEKSFSKLVGGAVSYGLGAIAGETVQAYDAGKRVTEQLGITSKAATDQMLLQQKGQTATVLGSNPEANVPAVQAVGKLFGQ